MPALKLSSGAVFTTIGWLLTADALLGALAFVAVWQSVAEFGGRFPPDVIYILMFPLLATGGLVTLHGARFLPRSIGAMALLFPCLQLLACVPWALCTTP